MSIEQLIKDELKQQAVDQAVKDWSWSWGFILWAVLLVLLVLSAGLKVLPETLGMIFLFFLMPPFCVFLFVPLGALIDSPVTKHFSKDQRLTDFLNNLDLRTISVEYINGYKFEESYKKYEIVSVKGKNFLLKDSLGEFKEVTIKQLVSLDYLINGRNLGDDASNVFNKEYKLRLSQ